MKIERIDAWICHFPFPEPFKPSWVPGLASPANSQRQYSYAKTRGDMDVYTPQIIIDGNTHFVGSSKSVVKAAIDQLKRKLVLILHALLLICVLPHIGHIRLLAHREVSLDRIERRDRREGARCRPDKIANLRLRDPGNTVHGMRNIGDGDAILCIAYPSVGVTLNFVEGVEI